jgi:hypothetical protein
MKTLMICMSILFVICLLIEPKVWPPSGSLPRDHGSREIINCNTRIARIYLHGAMHFRTIRPNESACETVRGSR